MRNTFRWSGRWTVLARPLLLAPFLIPSWAHGQVKRVEHVVVVGVDGLIRNGDEICALRARLDRKSWGPN